MAARGRHLSTGVDAAPAAGVIIPIYQMLGCINQIKFLDYLQRRQLMIRKKKTSIDVILFPSRINQER
jgi:hypothetical protein